jgi:hypothetical protein
VSKLEYCSVNLKYINKTDVFFCNSSNNRGNLIEILKWSAKTDPLAKAVLEESAGNATYLSHQIQNELLSIMANQIRDNIAEKVRKKIF